MSTIKHTVSAMALLASGHSFAQGSVLAIHQINGTLVIATPEYIEQNCGLPVMACTIPGKERDTWIVPPPPVAKFNERKGGGKFGAWLQLVGTMNCPTVTDPVTLELCGHELWHSAAGAWH